MAILEEVFKYQVQEAAIAMCSGDVVREGALLGLHAKHGSKIRKTVRELVEKMNANNYNEIFGFEPMIEAFAYLLEKYPKIDKPDIT